MDLLMMIQSPSSICLMTSSCMSSQNCPSTLSYDVGVFASNGADRYVTPSLSGSTSIILKTARNFSSDLNSNPLTSNITKRTKLVGFGYDSSIKDYKLVCVIFLPRYQVQVYSLKTNSWKVIEMALLRRIGVSLSDGGIALNGSIHWLVDSGEGKFNRWIVGFDLKADKFIEVQFPPLDPNIYCVNNLKVDGGCLGVYYSYRKKKDTFQVIMWTMNNDKKEEWTKLPTITSEEEGTKLLGFGYDSLTDDFKLVMVRITNCNSSCRYRVDLYSLKTIAWKKIRDVPDQFDPHLEEFTELLLPIEIRKESRKHVVELGGYLGVYYRTRPQNL
ncbi:hypothetical protein LguiA_029917 [Lonicera macranthoides]